MHSKAALDAELDEYMGRANLSTFTRALNSERERQRADHTRSSATPRVNDLLEATRRESRHHLQSSTPSRSSAPLIPIPSVPASSSECAPVRRPTRRIPGPPPPASGFTVDRDFNTDVKGKGRAIEGYDMISGGQENEEGSLWKIWSNSTPTHIAHGRRAKAAFFDQEVYKTTPLLRNNQQSIPSLQDLTLRILALSLTNEEGRLSRDELEAVFTYLPRRSREGLARELSVWTDRGMLDGIGSVLFDRRLTEKEQADQGDGDDWDAESDSFSVDEATQISMQVMDLSNSSVSMSFLKAHLHPSTSPSSSTPTPSSTHTLSLLSTPYPLLSLLNNRIFPSQLTRLSLADVKLVSVDESADEQYRDAETLTIIKRLVRATPLLYFLDLSHNRWISSSILLLISWQADGTWELLRKLGLKGDIIPPVERNTVAAAIGRGRRQWIDVEFG